MYFFEIARFMGKSMLNVGVYLRMLLIAYCLLSLLGVNSYQSLHGPGQGLLKGRAKASRGRSCNKFEVWPVEMFWCRRPLAGSPGRTPVHKWAVRRNRQ